MPAVWLAALLCAALGPRPQPLGSSTLRFPESLSPIQGLGLGSRPTDVHSEAHKPTLLAVLGHWVAAEWSGSRISLDPCCRGQVLSGWAGASCEGTHCGTRCVFDKVKLGDRLPPPGILLCSVGDAQAQTPAGGLESTGVPVSAPPSAQPGPQELVETLGVQQGSQSRSARRKALRGNGGPGRRVGVPRLAWP